MDEHADSPPRTLRPIRDELVSLTDEFCGKFLDDEYKTLARELAACICECDLSVQRGRRESWASGIIHALGSVNFLTDTSFEPCMTWPEVAEAFGVAQTTMENKSRLIRKQLNIMPLAPAWCVDSLLDDNPLVWFIEVDGFLLDIRDAPRDVQEDAFRQGLIPYIPADRARDNDLDDGIIARIGPGGTVS